MGLGFTPGATAVLRKRLRLALQRLRGRSREALLKRGLVVRGIVHPAHGELGLVVHARRASSAPTVVAARRGLPALAGQRTTIHAHVRRAGRRLLRSGRRLVLDVRLRLVARPDSRLSEAKGVLRLGRAASGAAPAAAVALTKPGVGRFNTAYEHSNDPPP